MGSSWRYRHVAIMPYYIGSFSLACLYAFHGLALDGRAREFTHRWKTMGLHRSKQKNKSAQLAGPTFSQHFPTQVSPHYIQLDPIYYDQVPNWKRILVLMMFHYFPISNMIMRQICLNVQFVASPQKSEIICWGI